jgi:hypothetical protein
MTGDTRDTARRVYRLRTPLEGAQDAVRGTAVSVRVDTERPAPFRLYLAVGGGRRRIYVSEAEAWALWRCLSEAVASLGDPPDFVHTVIQASGR